MSLDGRTRRRPEMVKGRAIAIVVAAALAADPALADDVPNIGSGPIYHFSLNPSPVRIELVHDRAGKGSFLALILPRPYVIFVSTPRPNSKALLPAVVETNHVEIAFVDGSGEAWSVAVAERARRDGIDGEVAGKLLRLERTTIALHPSTNQNYATDTRADITRRFSYRDSALEKLAHYTGTASYSYYVGSPDDEFLVAKCEGRLNPGFLCTYDVVVAKGVTASVKFVDFRLHGGRAYANRRVRFAREVACRFLTRC